MALLTLAGPRIVNVKLAVRLMVALADLEGSATLVAVMRTSGLEGGETPGRMLGAV